ncbi:MAG: hypothetical protein M0Q46_02860 [Endomicrobiales bacterium]|nr:hypothetical protein [Endomicrobiales bacterium]
MKTLKLKPVKVSKKLLAMLEKRGLIITPTPSKKIMQNPSRGGVEILYKTDTEYGTHKMIAVGKTDTNIMLTTHPDNEDVILINNTGKKFKPLYLIIAIHKQSEFEKRARARTLSPKDVLAIELEYNSQNCFFTVLKDVPHCEITKPGKGQYPVFFVTEPSDLKMDIVKCPQYSFELVGNK